MMGIKPSRLGDTGHQHGHHDVLHGQDIQDVLQLQHARKVHQVGPHHAAVHDGTIARHLLPHDVRDPVPRGGLLGPHRLAHHVQLPGQAADLLAELARQLLEGGVQIEFLLT